MAAKSGVAKGWEVRTDGVCRSSDRDYPSDDWTPIDAMQISLIAEQHGWDPDGWFASKWETLVHTPMRPIFDNVEYLMGLSRADKRAGRGADELIKMGLIEIEALTFIRGRSLPQQYIIIDEAHNLTPH
jgi:hypothetical protein